VLRQGFLYLVAIIDWATRQVLSWRLSNTLTAGFGVEALSEALARFGKPDIFNTDQGAQFTSDEFTQMLRDHGIAISMDGRGRCHDNIFVERLWWTVKDEWVYLRTQQVPLAANSSSRMCRQLPFAGLRANSQFRLF
jgi:putative transposase